MPTLSRKDGMIFRFSIVIQHNLDSGLDLNFRDRSFRWNVLPQISQQDKLVVFTACDSKYLEYAIPLVRSLDFFSPGYQFILHVINPRDADLERVRSVGATLRATRLAISSEHVDLSRLAPVAVGAYYASARFFVMPDLLESAGLPALCLDADSLFVNPIDGRFTDEGQADVAVYSKMLNQEVADKRKVNNSVILFDSSSKVRAFLTKLRRRLMAHFNEGTAGWYIDQEVFARLLQGDRFGLTVASIKPAYVDWNFSGKSIIWTAKGVRKHTDPRYKMMLQLLTDNRPDFIDIATDAAPTPADEPVVQAPVAIILPRLDLPWKPIDEATPVPTLKEDVVALRLYWKQFAILLANALEKMDVRVQLHELPPSLITPEHIDSLGHSLVFVPHRCTLNFGRTRTSVLFFMQEYFGWVFVVDPMGWSACSSAYPFDVKSIKPKRKGVFQEYRRRLAAGELTSKFNQLCRRSRWSLMWSREIPLGKYVFFPLQIPTDQAIRYFSDYSEEEVVTAVIEWSKQSGVPVVFKPHPVSKKAMAKFEQQVRAAGCYWSAAHVHDLAAHAAAVFTINSGVGFEALFHLKPVVTFGRAEYDCVTQKSTPQSLDKAWQACQKLGRVDLEKRYERFVDGFLTSYAVDMSSTASSHELLDEIAAKVKKEIDGEI